MRDMSCQGDFRRERRPALETQPTGDAPADQPDVVRWVLVTIFFSGLVALAAQAMEEGLVLVTRDTAFRACAGLRLLDA